MKLIPFIFIMLSLLWGCTQPQATPENKEKLEKASKAVEQISSAVEVGTNITNYAQTIAAAKPDIDGFVLANGNSALSQKMSQFLQGHLVALQWWDCKVNNVTDYVAAAVCRDGVLPEIYASFPEFKKDIQEAIRAKPADHQSDSLDPDAVLQKMWINSSVRSLEIKKEILTEQK